jgi:hypothetical protein
MENLNLIPFTERTKFNIAILMYKAIHNNVPDHIQNKITLNSDIHTRSLRSTCNLSLFTPFPKCENFKNSLAYHGPFIWNSLPEIVRKQESLSHFKNMYKKFVLTNAK